MLAGDLVEQTEQPGDVPGFGDDCYPMEWPLTLDVVLGLTTAQSVVVPGHGAVVDREFVEEQRNAIGIVAETIRDLATRGVPVDDALAAAEWPYPRERAGATPYAAGTSTCPAARSGSRSSDRHPAGVARDRGSVDRGMTETPDSDYTDVSVPDEELPEDLQPGEDNPLADAADDHDAERQDLGDPHIDGLERDDDDNLVAPRRRCRRDASDDAHHGAPDSDDDRRVLTGSVRLPS